MPAEALAASHLVHGKKGAQCRQWQPAGTSGLQTVTVGHGLYGPPTPERRRGGPPFRPGWHHGQSCEIPAVAAVRRGSGPPYPRETPRDKHLFFFCSKTSRGSQSRKLEHKKNTLKGGTMPSSTRRICLTTEQRAQNTHVWNSSPKACVRDSSVSSLLCPRKRYWYIRYVHHRCAGWTLVQPRPHGFRTRSIPR